MEHCPIYFMRPQLSRHLSHRKTQHGKRITDQSPNLKQAHRKHQHTWRDTLKSSTEVRKKGIRQDFCVYPHLLNTLLEVLAREI